MLIKSSYFFPKFCVPKNAATIPATATKYVGAILPNVDIASFNPQSDATTTANGYSSSPNSANHVILR